MATEKPSTMKCILLFSWLCFVSFTPEANAWSQTYCRSRSSVPILQGKTVSRGPNTPCSRPASYSTTQLHLKWIEKSEEDDLPKLTLSDEEDAAIRTVARSLSSDDAYGVGWFDRPEAWAAAKQEFPLLEQYDDADLREAYLKQKPKLLEVFTDTPLGPFLLINLLVKFSGFTWCDTPFGQATACLPQ